MSAPVTTPTVPVCVLRLDDCQHVHIQGCPDLVTYDRSIVAAAHEIAATSRHHVILDFCEREDLDPDGWADVLPRVTFFPCTTSLPIE